MTRLIIIGGVAGGATAAARARRLDEHAEIILFERGEYISFANCGLPYYIGSVIKNRDDLLVTNPEDFRARYNVDVRTFSEVLSIDKDSKQIEVKNLITDESYVENYDKLILSPGAEPVRPPLDGIGLPQVFSLRSLPDTDRIKSYIENKNPESAVVVGGGFIGLEMAENLALRGVSTSVVEMADQVMAPLDHEMAGIVHAHLKEQEVTLYLNSGVKSFGESGNKVVVNTNDGKEITCDLVILSIGIRPENKLAKEAGLDISDRGGILVDATLRTSDPDIFAVGDAVVIRDFITGQRTNTALAGPANKQGRIAADNAMGRKSIYRGSQGSSVVKVFDLTVAATGASEKTLNLNGIPYKKIYTHSGSHASYYPGSGSMAIKLLFSPGSGKILGAQIVGSGGVDKRIDVLATAIRGSMTVFDLEELELAYAPPYSSAKDPVNIAGFAASNMLKGDVDTIDFSQLVDLDEERTVIIDLRNQDELDSSGYMERALHIPLNELRSRLDELDKSKQYILYCAAGFRGYVGYRIMVQNGFSALNLSGGYITYMGAAEKVMVESSATSLWLSE